MKLTHTKGTSHFAYRKINIDDGSLIESADSTVNHPYVTTNGSAESPPDKSPWEPAVFKITPLFKSKTSIVNSPGSFRYSRPYGTSQMQYWTGSGPYTGHKIGSYFFDFGTSIPDDKSLVLTNAYAKVAKNDLDLAAEIGELRETIGFIRHPFREIGELLSKIGRDAARSRRGKPFSEVKKSDFLDTANSSYLEYRFALEPLFRTWIAALEALWAKAAAFDPEKIYVARASNTRRGSKNITKSAGVGYAVYTSHGVLKYTQRTNACVFYRLTKPLPRLSQYGLSPADMVQAIWELTSYSFVVDRFINIGNWLQSWLIEPEVEILGNTVSTKLWLEGKATTKPNYASKYTVEYWDPAKVRYQEESYDRKVNVMKPLFPAVTSLKTLTNVKHIADHIALTLAAIRR